MRVRELRDEAQDDRYDFISEYGEDGNCSCHLNPPCNSCVHPGNPHNQEDDEFYKPAKVEVDVMQAVRDFCKG